ncbi:MAG: hypothetical protein R3190_19255, partial [Thermoanaerobaculia bacterium]|nr:hypothetical protein [Thermoanaerobaculia bacterium]
MRSISAGVFCVRSTIVMAALALLGSPAVGQSSTPDLSFDGHVWVDYGDGDRYPAEDGGDRFDVSQVYVGMTATKDNFEAFVALGASNVFEGTVDDEVFIPEAFITWKSFAGVGSNLVVGLQPIYFGLKSAGFPGDRTIQSGLEFGGAGGLAVSQQVAPAIVYEYRPGDTFAIRGGFFDTSSSTAEYFEDTGLGDIDGSSLSDNYFIDVRWGSPENRGFYAYLGWEERYIGDAINDSEAIFDAGLGWGNAMVDVSYEYIDFDQSFFGLTEDETYSVAELTLHLTQRLDLYADWAEADVSEASTTRFGLIYAITEAVSFQAEYSE